MRRLAALLLLTLLVAGCVQEAAPASIGLPDLPLDEPFASVVTVIDPEGGRGEPSFGAMPDGTLFAVGRTNGGPRGAPLVYRSADGGATWEDLGAPTAPAPDNDPDLVVDKDGTVWVDSLTLASNSVAVSRDGGETWTVNHLAMNAPVADRQYVVATQGGEAYIYSHQLPSFHQMVAKTTDHGATWIPLGSSEMGNLIGVTQSSGWGGGGFWNEATGSVFFTWTLSGGLTTGYDWRPAFSVTRDGGQTFEQGWIEGERGERLGLSLVVGAADDAGNAYLAWGEADGDDVGVYLAVSVNDGETWGAPIRVDAGTGSNVFPAIAAGAPGKVAIAYYEADEAAHPDDVKGKWNVTLAWTDDALAAAPAFQYAELSNGTVKEGPICISGTACQGGRQFLDYFTIHRLPDGRVGGVFNMLEKIKEGKVLTVYGATAEPLLGP